MKSGGRRHKWPLGSHWNLAWPTHPPSAILSLSTSAPQVSANSIRERAVWVATEQMSKKAPREMVGALLPPHPQPGFSCPSHPQEIQGIHPFCAIKSGPFLCLASLALSWYPARHPFQGSVVSFKLCYYGNGRDVNNPTCLDNQVGRGSGARGIWLLCPLPPLPRPPPRHLGEDLKGHTRSFYS